MAILSAMQSAALRLMGKRPSVFFGSNNQFEIELCDLVNEVARDIAATHDWQAITRIHTISGNGSSTSFPLPADYDRQLLRSDVQDPKNWLFGFIAVPDVNEFLFQEKRGFQPNPGIWTIYGNRMRFTPAPSAGVDALFPYITQQWGANASNEPIAQFTADSDRFLMPERLLTLGLIWRWRENKKLDYTADQEAFVKAISEYASRDKGSRIIRRNSRVSFPNTHVAWPWTLGGV